MSRQTNIRGIHFNNGLSVFARLSTVLQILLFLPLTLVTLSTQAFLLLSLLLFIHSLIHGTMHLFWRWPALSIMQVPMHPFLLLLCFNIFSQSVPPVLISAANWWGKFLSWSSPCFVVMEGLSSLLVAQKLGRLGRSLAGEGESYQFMLLVASAAAYVGAAWRIATVSIIFSQTVSLAYWCLLVLLFCSNITIDVDAAGRRYDRLRFLDAYRI